MLFGEAVRIALASLNANKLRSLLTVLGILIGVSSVVAVVAITDGLDRYMSEKVLELGTKAFRLQRMPDIITSHEMWMQMMKRKRLNMEDYEAVKKACTLCSEVGAQVWTGSNVKRGRTIQKNVGIAGVTENISRIGTIRELESGRHVVQQDVEQAAMVAVIGTDLRDAFFGMMEPIGKEIDVDGHPLRVIGVAEKKGVVFGESQDNFIWMPLTTFMKLYGARRSFSIQAEARTMAVFEAAQDQVRVAMRARRHLTYNKPDDFNIETGESVMELWQTMTRGIYVVTFVVTAISLLVGGIVVMNIMLVSVTERIREIGIRMAVGARERDILLQFLAEAVVLSLLGGTIGIIFGYGVSKVLGKIKVFSQFQTVVSPGSVLLAFLFAASVGIFFGFYPARKASKLDPIEALRYE
ncbi:MAG TPA: ABC transporter permease [Terriglobales bacterium]|nr:ABC transporter permease [Terriglobales bacterium]